jgi:hypothetical protein
VKVRNQRKLDYSSLLCIFCGFGIVLGTRERKEYYSSLSCFAEIAFLVWWVCSWNKRKKEIKKRNYVCDYECDMKKRKEQSIVVD